MEEDEDGVYQDNEEGGDDDIEERMQMANNQANNFQLSAGDIPEDSDIFK